MSGWEASSETSTGPEFFPSAACLNQKRSRGRIAFLQQCAEVFSRLRFGPGYAEPLGKIYPVDFRIADVEQAVGNVARILYAQSGVLYVEDVVGIVGEYYGGDILLFSGLSPEALNGVSGPAISQQGQHRSVGAGQRRTRCTGPSLTNGAPVRLSQLLGAVF